MKIIFLILLLFSGSIVCLEAELVASYTFSGNLWDTSIYSNNAIAYGNATLTTDRFGNANSAYYFDGSGDYLRIANASQINFTRNQNFSVSFWMKANANQVDLGNGDNDVVEKWTGASGYPFVVRYLNSKQGVNEGTVHAARWNGSASASVGSNGVKINDGQFHHILFMHSAETLYFYIDGILLSTASNVSTGETANASDLYIASRGGTMNFFAGVVDDLNIYNHALSTAEINSLVQIPEPMSCLSLFLGLIFFYAWRQRKH